ncbi:uncharacterized protein LOC111331473 [Stylophora pistillata]|uniref:uncharacterized protein LOC111331473 n=1 Tax=Stylophora pistillata TaxID=50429 RepID=UPI000C049474|nr:uncharacterized protein LOC111331473 [Stylophora pistillata]
MSSIVTLVFKSTIGLIVNKGRDKAAKQLKDGDVIDQKFRSLIVREIDDVKSRLDGLSRKDLLTSISFFKEGIELLYEVFDKVRSQSGFGAVTARAACAETVCVAQEMKNLELSDLDESETRKLGQAKEAFKDARQKATEAFNNEALETSDRILAMQYRVMATILEAVDNPADALARCRVCIDDLHSMAAVKKSFDVQPKKGLQAVRGLVGKEERREIICNVYHVNPVIYDVRLAFGEDLSFAIYPTHVVDTGKEDVELFTDERVIKILRKQGIEHCCVTPWSFGAAGEEEQQLKEPWGITTNSNGEFIVGEYDNGCVKVFDRGGKFVKHFSLPTDEVDSKLFIYDVATDINDNIFVLTELQKPGTKRSWWVYKLTKTADLHHTFRLRKEDWSRGLSVSDAGKILTLRNTRAVEEYNTNGEFVRNFGEGILHNASDITIANDGHIMVGNFDGVHIFSEHGDHLNYFQLQNPHLNSVVRLTYLRAGKHVVVASSMKQLLHVETYTNDGKFERRAQIRRERSYWLKGIALTTDGRIAVTSSFSTEVLIV